MMTPQACLFRQVLGVFKTNFLQMKDTYPEKSPRWWFDNYLPEPYRSQAIENYDGEYQSVTSLKRAITLGFVWPEDTFKQWEDLASRAQDGQLNTPLP